MKKILASALSAMLFALCSSALAQQPNKVPRVGYLLPGNPTSDSVVSEAIRLGGLVDKETTGRKHHGLGNRKPFFLTPIAFRLSPS